MNIFSKSLLFALLASLAFPGGTHASLSFWGKAIAYFKEHPYLYTGLTFGLGSSFYAYKWLSNKMRFEEKTEKQTKKALKESKENHPMEFSNEASYLLKKYLDDNWRYPLDLTELMEFIKFLENDAHPDVKGKSVTILTQISAIRIEQVHLKDAVIKVCEKLIEKRADLNIQDNIGRTGLMYAAYRENNDLINFLLNHGANPNIQDNYGFTALMFPVSSCGIYGIDWRSDSCIAVVKTLLERGADPNIQDPNGNTALMYAIQNYERKGSGNYSEVIRAVRNIVMLLLEHGANVELENQEGLTAFDIACKYNVQEIMDLLILYKNFKTIENDQKSYISLLPKELKAMTSRYICNISE